MNFVSYLISKKINPEVFKAHEPDLYQQWEKEFEYYHNESFTSQKKFLLNRIRRKYIHKTN